MDATNGAELWGEKFDRQASDVSMIEEQIANDISDGLRLRLSGEEKDDSQKIRRGMRKHTSYISTADSTGTRELGKN